jgi:HK97 family phage major capsid protein
MTTAQASIPVLSALPTARFLTGVGARKPVTEMKWSSDHIVAEELAAILPLPTAWLDDSQFNIWAEIRPRLAEACAQAIDLAVLTGLGAPASFPPGGVLALAGPPIAAQPPPGQPDIVEAVSRAMQKIEDSGLDVNGFAARSTVRGAFRGVRTTTGEWLVWAPDEPGAPPNMFGSPLTYTVMGLGALTNPDLIAGDWSALVVGLRQDMRFDISNEGVLYDDDGKVVASAFQDDLSLMRVYMRLGCAIGRPLIKKPDGTDGYGDPFAAVKAPGAAPLGEAGTTLTGSGKNSTATTR